MGPALARDGNGSRFSYIKASEETWRRIQETDRIPIVAAPSAYPFWYPEILQTSEQLGYIEDQLSGLEEGLQEQIRDDIRCDVQMTADHPLLPCQRDKLSLRDALCVDDRKYYRIGEDETVQVSSCRPILCLSRQPIYEHKRVLPHTLAHELCHINEYISRPVRKITGPGGQYRDNLSDELAAYFTQTRFFEVTSHWGDKDRWRYPYDDGHWQCVEQIRAAVNGCSPELKNLFEPNDEIIRKLARAGLSFVVSMPPPSQFLETAPV